jgi:hypothetical protein
MDAHNGGVEAQNGALESRCSVYRWSPILITVMKSPGPLIRIRIRIEMKSWIWIAILFNYTNYIVWFRSCRTWFSSWRHSPATITIGRRISSFLSAVPLLMSVICLISYFLLVALSPVLHVEGSRTRPGIIVVSCYLFVLSSFFAEVAFHLSFSTFAPLRLVAIV